MEPTVLDAGVLIGLLDADDPHHVAALAAVRSARDRGEEMVLPASAYAEILVGPMRRGGAAVGVVDALLHALPVRVQPLDRATAARAAGIRAAHGSIRLPDALVIATALELRAGRVLSTDRRWPDLHPMIEVDVV